MKIPQKHLMMCAAVAMVIALSACSGRTEQPAQDTGQVNSESSESAGEVNTEANNEATTAEVSSPDGTAEIVDTDEEADSEAGGDNAAAEGTQELPDVLPTDFPMPDDAHIQLANSGDNDGKKTAMVIYTTEQDMKTVSKMYKDYFEAKKLTDAGQTLDDKNIIIQGTDPETKQQWSLIGGALASKEGTIELTLTWAES